MPIKRLRDPDTLADVAGEYLSILGYKEIMHLTGRSKSMPYKWADPDNQKDVLRDIDTLLALDAACLERGQHAPFFNFVSRQIAKLANGSSQEAEDLIKMTLSLGSALGGVQDAVNAATDRYGPGGMDVTPNEANTIKQQTKCLRELADRVDAAVDANASARLDNVARFTAGAAE